MRQATPRNLTFEVTRNLSPDFTKQCDEEVTATGDEEEEDGSDMVACWLVVSSRDGVWLLDARPGSARPGFGAIRHIRAASPGISRILRTL